MALSKIKVFNVDDSALFRRFLLESLSKEDRFEVIGSASNALEALKKIPELKPDVVTLDIEMPGMNGLELLKNLLPICPVPVVLCSSLNIRVFDALAAGAVDYVRKPDFNSKNAADAFERTLKSKVLLASYAHVHLPSGSPKPVPVLRTSVSTSGIRKYTDSSRVIAIGASTGGTEAILSVVKDLPADTPGIVVTQHMPAGFTEMYAERLQRICHMDVKEAKNGDKVCRGRILIAPGGFQMRVIRIGNGYEVTVTEEDRVNGHRPSVDVLFNSVSQHVREKAIGVLLTGMGADGAAGLLRMRKNGAYTIGQDKDSCVVYGMPMEAWKIGAVIKQAPLSQIPQLILNQLNGVSR